MGEAERTASRRGSPFYVVGRAREGENKDVSRTTYYNSSYNRSEIKEIENILEQSLSKTF